jgi:RecA-family ATPase
VAKFVSTKQLFALPPSKPTDWVIEGMIRTGRKRPSLLAGLPEAGKSTLAHQIAIAVATGAPFMGRTTQKSHVLYWKNEETEADVKEDLIQAGLVNDDSLTVILPEAKDDNIQVLVQALTKYESKLCIVETLADFFPGYELEKSKDMRDALSRFATEVGAYFPNTAFLMLAQFNKSTSKDGLSLTRISGSTSIPAGADAKLYLEQASNADDRRIFHTTVRKGTRIERTYLVFDEHTRTSTLGMKVKDEAKFQKDEKKLKKLTELDAKIKEVLTATSNMPKMKAVKAVGGHREDTKKRIDELIKHGYITQTTGGEKGTALILNLSGIEMPDLQQEQEYLNKLTGKETEAA